MLNLQVPPPIGRMHFSICSLPGRVIFTPWHVDQVISGCDRAKEISDTTSDVAVKKWLSPLAILNLPFEPLQILAVGIQEPEVVLKRVHSARPY